MREAVGELSVAPDFILIDGLHMLPLEIPQKALVKGDARSVSIAAASIIAKVSRDRIMEMYHRQFPQYNFLHKTKGTVQPSTEKIIQEIGMCKIHRRSFHLKDQEVQQMELDWS